ncbi:MFS transporter [Pelosinus baikalensis]|uniref:MFS transporter n=1 Tax=Pelosinus baikalensis TaxID=2892015 RepID=A0ABS8HYA6_9FIRM|nr:MFS transporter [Pelosinus baikalensis]MCC5468154.1 MFS transporter [Pelosinus baikalensis]
MFLINRNFCLLLFGQIVSQLGDKAYNIALMWWLLEKTKSPFLVSSFLVIAMLPELIFGPVAGVYIDRWNKKKILVVSDFVRGIIVLTLAILFQSELLEIWHIYVAALCISLCSALFNPTTMSVIPVIVEKDKLQQANALSQMVVGAVSIIGPLLGSSSIVLVGYIGVLIFNGISYIISGIAELFLCMTTIESQTEESVIYSLTQGFRFIRADMRVLVIVTVIAIVHVFVGSIVVIMPFLAKLLDGNGINNLGLLQSAIGGGMIIGAGYISKYVRKSVSELYLSYAIVCMGLGILALGTLQLIHIELVEIYVIVCIIIGSCIAIASVLWRTIAQLCVPAEMSGRVFSVFSTTGNISLPISIGIFGLLLNYMTPGLLFFVAGSCLMVFGVVLLYSNRKNFESIVKVR